MRADQLTCMGNLCGLKLYFIRKLVQLRCPQTSAVKRNASVLNYCMFLCFPETRSEAIDSKKA